MTPADRLRELADHAALFAPWTGPFTREDLTDLVAAELGPGDPLGKGSPQGDRIAPAATLLHIVSGNTPHAAFQSLLRGLILGCHNRIKLPSRGLPAFEAALGQFPPALSALVETSPALPDAWLDEAAVLIIYGNDDTIDTLRARAPAGCRIIAHGPKLSIGIVLADPENAARLAAGDICRFDQRGCLSVHDVYLHPDCPLPPRHFGDLLAAAMAEDVRHHPPTPLTPSEAGAITTLRETTRFLAASDPAASHLWESPRSTDWTVIHESDPSLKVSCLNRVAYVKPWPADPTTLGPAGIHVGCVASHPFSPDLALGPLRPSRICPLGETQHPPLTWYQDGYAPLASLIPGERSG